MIVGQYGDNIVRVIKSVFKSRMYQQGRLTNKQTGGLTNKQTGRRTDKQTDEQTDGQTDGKG